MNRRLLITLLMLPVLAHAEPSSNIAWTPKMLRFVKSGSPLKGKELAAACAGCHGEQGISQTENTPSLAGQLATYTYKQLRDYVDNKRTNVMMNAMVQGLSEQDSADLAAWYASLPAARNKGSSALLSRAEKLVSKGNGAKIIPPCFTCHGSKGEGERQDIPSLAGQRIDYLITTMTEYKTGIRRNDVYSRMRLIAEQLSEEDIKQLAQYYTLLK